MANENNESLKQFHVKKGGTEIISSILLSRPVCKNLHIKAEQNSSHSVFYPENLNNSF